ncbi:hypothetical protein DSM106972_015910 [Dulcicalothrix desertica PCC 7102]|uniref:Uncharacterized protein n=1 Tax=Dulcicalothrix desertica PCC 7102 TaxID=232991 RepID=A0A433VQK4_9CYAN|nr:hypothetical protein [Dulcicalothrix desertica]RUT08423.1 hypothetical protein DSM106972_015910 [Dulcicalothrix desertica PCC 7102]TWH40288.1 hypothetical protein CAL7102_09595 [Dulcicalothrix desertica PCC 7102]
MARDRKYSRILQAAKYYSAVDNYIKYITDASKRGGRVGTGDPRPKSKKYFIDPFGIKLGAGQVVPVTSSEPAFTAYSADIAGRFQATEANEDNIIPVRSYRAARAIITTGRTTSGTAKTSRVTGLKYLSYGGKSISVAFGRKNETEEFAAAAAEVKAAIQTRVAGAIVTISPEVVPIV